MQSNFKSSVSFYKKQDSTEARKLTNELRKIDNSLKKIKKYVTTNKDLGIDKLIEVVIFRGLVTKDNLTKLQLYNSTKELIEDILLEI